MMVLYIFLLLMSIDSYFLLILVVNQPFEFEMEIILKEILLLWENLTKYVDLLYIYVDHIFGDNNWIEFTLL